MSLQSPEAPDDLKHIVPYLQRAAELKGREPLVAYYCGVYAANLALTKGYRKSPENDKYVMALITRLEKEKEELLTYNPSSLDQEGAQSYILQFAMRIFLAADNEDRAGKATKKTGRLFLVASQFLEVLKGLGEIPEELEDRIRYAKWKATDIVKAMNEGRRPVAGPPILEDQSMDSQQVERRRSSIEAKDIASLAEKHHRAETVVPKSSTSRSASSLDEGALGVVSSSPAIPQIDRRSSAAPSASVPAQGSPSNHSLGVAGSPVVPSNVLGSDSGSGSSAAAVGRTGTMPIQTTLGSDSRMAATPLSMGMFNLDQKTIGEAEKYARYAVSAIQFEDVPTGIRNLEQSLQLLWSLRKA